MAHSITLFSPYSPDLGGGGTNLRSLVPELRDFDLQWLYTAPRVSSFPGTRRVAAPMAGGSFWHDLSRAAALWSGAPTRTLGAVLHAMKARGSNNFWVVGHNEGIVVARTLARAGARVHLTIQDDVPDGMFGRSQRYRALSPLIRPTYEATLRRMTSIDVTSDGMQRYYRERLGLSSVVVHPFVPALPPSTRSIPAEDAITVGHIGSIYAADDWRTFLRALQGVAGEMSRPARMIMIGLAARYRPVAREFGDLVQICDDLPEAEAVERLAECHFLYAMYPFDRRSEVFRRTSLPTKLTSYLKCQRPIFAHSPLDSTMVDIVNQYGLGIACDATDVSELRQRLRQCLTLQVSGEAYERARSEIYGTANVERLRACLERL